VTSELGLFGDVANTEKRRDNLPDIELSDGGVIEAPLADGEIRRRDIHGNTEEVRYIKDDNWQDWADLWDLTPEDFTPDEVDIINLIGQLVQQHGPAVGLTKCDIKGDHNGATIMFTYRDQTWEVGSDSIF